MAWQWPRTARTKAAVHPSTQDEKLTYCIQPRLPLWVGKVGLKLSPTQYDILLLSLSIFIIYILHKLKIATLRINSNLIAREEFLTLSQRG